MSSPVTSYNVTTPGSVTPVVVQAQTFQITPTGALVFCSESSQTVAAFAPAFWEQVEPVVTP